jgi:hypothetical protein
MDTDELNTNSSCESLVNNVTMDSSCDEYVNTDDDIIDLSCDSLVKADGEVAAINYISCAYDEQVHTIDEPTDLSCYSHVDNDDVSPDSTYDSHVDSDDDSTTTSVENLPAFIKIPPNKLELCETECGEIGLIVDPEYWDSGHFLSNYNYWGLVSMRAFSPHSLYGYIKITLCSGAALALFE